MMTPGLPSCQEVPDRLAGAQERAADVDGEHLVEVRARQLVTVAGDLDAGVVDEHVDPAELAHRLADHPLDVLLLGDVTLDEHVAHAGLLHLVHARIHLLRGLGCLIGLA